MPEGGSGRLMRAALGLKNWFADPEYPSHPSTTPQTLGETVTKKALKFFEGRQSRLEADEPYLEQYFHPDKDILPLQSLRPQSATIPPNYKVRHAAPRTDGIQYKGIDPKSLIATKNLAGLGNYKHSGTPDYESAYDLWDFDTNAPLLNLGGGPDIKGVPLGQKVGDYLARKAMGMVGSPYAVYERYPRKETNDDRRRREGWAVFAQMDDPPKEKKR